VPVPKTEKFVDRKRRYREVNGLVVPQEASKNDEGYQKYWVDLEVLIAAAKRMSKRLADGELENFRLTDDKKSILKSVGWPKLSPSLGSASAITFTTGRTIWKSRRRRINNVGSRSKVALEPTIDP
jgi:hypothetical protein